MPVIQSDTKEGEPVPKSGAMKITVSKDGPYVVEGTMPVAEQHIEIDAAGQSIEWREGKSLSGRRRQPA